MFKRKGYRDFREEWTYKIRKAREAGYLRARHEINLERRLDPELKGVAEDERQRVAHIRWMQELDEKYLSIPYSSRIPKSGFKGTWYEYVAYMYGTFRSNTQIF